MGRRRYQRLDRQDSVKVHDSSEKRGELRCRPVVSDLQYNEER